MRDRVLIYGVTGSGKSTLARLVAQRAGLPYYAVDDLAWEPGWVSVPDVEQRARLTRICESDRWVLDAAYSRWADVVLARAEMIVALDYSRWLTLARLVRRTAMRNLRRTPICNGNTESLRRTFSADSIVVWHFRSFGHKREQMRAWEAQPPVPEYVRLTTPRATRQWLAGLELSGLGVGGRRPG